MAFLSDLISPFEQKLSSVRDRFRPAGPVDLPLSETIAFSDCNGIYREQIKKSQLRMVRDYAPLLKQFLEPGEEILLVMRACSPAVFWHEVLTQWMAYYLRRCTLVVTDRRIFHFPSKADYKPRFSLAQIRFGDVREIRLKMFLRRQFTVIYQDGKKETFTHVRNVFKLQDIMPVLEFHGLPVTAFRRRHHLCPRCTTPLVPGRYRCGSCSLEFKNELKATVFALLVPGGGYFYTNHPFVGIQNFLVENFLLLLWVFHSYFALTADSSPGTYSWPAAVIAVVFLVEKTLTVLQAKQFVREFIPEF